MLEKSEYEYMYLQPWSSTKHDYNTLFSLTQLNEEIMQLVIHCNIAIWNPKIILLYLQEIPKEKKNVSDCCIKQTSHLESRISFGLQKIY